MIAQILAVVQATERVFSKNSDSPAEDATLLDSIVVIFLVVESTQLILFARRFHTCRVPR